jgi:ectoine hydroxylase-related dioxygenase (phytanoyl-CoA dioxygenase family)
VVLFGGGFLLPQLRRCGDGDGRKRKELKSKMTTRQSVTSVLSPEQRERFQRDGYVIFDPEITEAVLDGVLRDVEGKYLYEGEKAEIDERGVVYQPGARPRIMNAWKASDDARAIALAPKVLAVCEELYGRKPLPFQTLNFPVGTQQSAHADAMHFNSDPPGQMCGVWLALEDMDMSNGPLVYFPGSQKMSLPTWEEIEGEDTGRYPDWDFDAFIHSRHRSYEAHVQKLIQDRGLQPEYGTIRKGEALLWSANLLHGGSPQNDPSRTRHSQVTHYYFEGCRYTTPMWDQDSYAHWRYPWWVRSEGFKNEESSIREAVEAALPEDATVAVMASEQEGFDLDGRRHRSFWPPSDRDDSTDPPGEAVRQLEALRAEGYAYVLVPRRHLSRLTSALNRLQQHLETNYRALLRDGGSCAIYVLMDGEPEARAA